MIPSLFMTYQRLQLAQRCFCSALEESLSALLLLELVSLIGSCRGPDQPGSPLTSLFMDNLLLDYSHGLPIMLTHVRMR